MDKMDAPFDEQMQDEQLYREQRPQLDNSDIAMLSSLLKQQEKLQAEIDKIEDAKAEILFGLIDDPYFAHNSDYNCEEYKIRFVCTQPTIKDRKWIKKQYEALDKKRTEIQEYEENYNKHGVTDFKSTPRIQVKILKNN